MPITIGTGAEAGAPYPSSLSLGPSDRVVEGVDVRLVDLVHDVPDELDIALTGPGGQTVMLMSDVAYTTACATPDLEFSMRATGPVPSDLLCSGLYLPTDDDSDELDLDVFPAPAPAAAPGDSLAVFNGAFPTGTWSLRVVDDTAGDGGSIADWRLSFNTRPTGLVRTDDISVTGSETQPALTLGVVRSGGSAPAPLGEAAVAWTTEPCAPMPLITPDAPATAGEDFATTGGVVTFAPGETLKPLELRLLDDRVPEPTECFGVRLKSASGDARLTTTPRITNVRVTNDDRPAARPSVAAPARQRVVRSKAVTLTAASVSDGTLAATGYIALKRTAAARIRLRPANVVVTAGQRVTLRLRLGRPALRAVRGALAASRRVTAVVKVTASDLAGGRATRSLTLRLRR